MAIGTDAAVWFYGTETTVISNTETIVDGAFNSGTGNTALTQTEHLDAELAEAELTCNMATDPSGGEGWHLYRQALNFEGTSDDPAPTTTYLHTFVGIFHLNSGTGVQNVKLHDVPLCSGDQQFWLRNMTGVSTDTSGQITLKVTAKALGPKA